MAYDLSLNYKSTGSDRILDELARIKAELAALKARQEQLANDPSPENWFGKFVHGVGVFNTLNKGFDFLVKRVGQLNAITTGWIDSALDVGTAYEQSRKKLESFLAGAADADKVVAMTKKLGMSTEYTARQVSDATTEFVALGFSAKEALAAMPGMLDFATSNMLSLEEATDIAAKTSNQFGLGMSDLTSTLDILNAMQATSGASVKEAAQSYKFLGITAEATGLKLEETAAMLGILGDAGIRGAMGGTGIRTLLVRLSTEAGTAKKAMQELGITTKDRVTGDMLPMTNVMDQLRSKFQALGKEEQNYYAARIAGSAGMNVVLKLFGQGARSVQEYAAEIKSMTGITTQMAQTMRESYAMSVEEATGAVEGMHLAIFELITGPASQLNLMFANVVQSITGQLEKIRVAVQKEGFTPTVIARGVQDIVSAAEPELRRFLDVVKTVVSGVALVVKNAAPGVLATVKDMIAPAKDYIAEQGKVIWHSLFTQQNIAGLKDLGTEIGTAIADAIIEAIHNTTTGKAIVAFAGLKTAVTVAAGATNIDKFVQSAVKTAPVGASTTEAVMAKAGVSTMSVTLIGIGAAALAALTLLTDHFNRKTGENEQEQRDIIGEYLKKLYDMRQEAVEGGDNEKVGRIDQQIALWENEAEKLSPGLFKQFRDAEVKADEVISEINENWSKVIAYLGEGLSPDELLARIQAENEYEKTPEAQIKKVEQQEKDAALKERLDAQKKNWEEKYARESYIKEKATTYTAQFQQEGLSPGEAAGAAIKQAAKDYEALQAAMKADAEYQEQKKKRLLELENEEKDLQADATWVRALNEVESKTRQIHKEMAEIAQIDLQAALKIEEVGLGIEKFLLEPTNQFKQQLADITGKFGEMRATLGEKRADLKEQFGIKGGEDAAQKDREKISTQREATLRKQLSLTQTDEGKGTIAERLGDLLKKRAEEAKTPAEKEQAAKGAERYYQQAGSFTASAEEKAVKAVELEQESMQRRKSTLQDLLSASGDEAALKVPVLQQLQEYAQKSGDVEGAVRYSEELKDAILADAKQQQEERKRELEYLRIIAESSQLTAERLGYTQDRFSPGNTPQPAATQQGQAQPQAAPGISPGFVPGAGGAVSPQGWYTKPPSPVEDWKYLKGLDPITGAIIFSNQ